MELLIKESEWKSITDPGIELKAGYPYWLKLANGDIVLSTYLQTELASGSVLKIQHNSHYAAKDAFIQPAVREGKCSE